ncbi:hypothetical protein JW978_01015 [Candidatus Dojkabacteria bacterium]|nr:hypothetical protein [Candidatus Dojkabacteria bacterium]
MKTVVVKLGGSMISKSEDKLIDFEYLARFKEVVEELITQDVRMFIVLGGGYLMRKYRDIAKAGGINETIQLHWIGTTSNNLNAEIVRAYMAELCNERIVAYEDYYDEKQIDFEEGKSIIVGGGGRAGHSGDVDALLMAGKINVDTIISLKDIDGVYTADPKKDPSATRLDQLTWDEYFKIIGGKKEHEPGGNYPVDPIASAMAKEAGKNFIVISGSDLESFKNALIGKEYIGTIVS